MALKILSTNTFDKNLKLMLKRGKNRKKLDQFINFIEEATNKEIDHYLLLPHKYRLHKLSGEYSNLWECHLEPDWLIIFDLSDQTLILENTGTHSDLFKK